jgi:endonuclease YncB( thermonuclease family)
MKKSCLTGLLVTSIVGLLLTSLARPLDAALLGRWGAVLGFGPLYLASLWLALAAGLLIFFYLWKPDDALWKAARRRESRGYLLGTVVLVLALSLVLGVSTTRRAISTGWATGTAGAASQVGTPLPWSPTPATPSQTLTSTLPASSPSAPPTSTPVPSPAASPEPTPSPTSTLTQTPDLLADPAACIPGGGLRQEAELVEIVDGDTIRVRLEDGEVYRVRYLGMNTPERGEMYFDETTGVNQDLLSSGPLQLLMETSPSDRFDRLLRHILAGETFVNFEMVRLGYAHTLFIMPDIACYETFLAAEAAARDSGSGLWGLPTQTPLPPPTSTPLGVQEFAVVELTSPVAVGAYATLAIQTSQGAACSLSYTTPAGSKSQAKGLGGTTAASSGVCSWRWFIGTGTRPGTGSLKITADGFTKSLPIVIAER